MLSSVDSRFNSELVNKRKKIENVLTNEIRLMVID